MLYLLNYFKYKSMVIAMYQIIVKIMFYCLPVIDLRRLAKYAFNSVTKSS